jgi:hypothetical protein
MVGVILLPAARLAELGPWSRRTCGRTSPEPSGLPFGARGFGTVDRSRWK